MNRASSTRPFFFIHFSFSFYNRERSREIQKTTELEQQFAQIQWFVFIYNTFLKEVHIDAVATYDEMVNQCKDKGITPPSSKEFTNVEYFFAES